MRIAIVFFSATSNTRIMAQTIKREFEARGAEAVLFDVTTPAARERGIAFNEYNATVFGFPVHSLRAPRLMREWLGTLDGNGMKCAMFFTYGGFLVHPAHYSTARILESRQFIVVSSAEFPGKHTYNLGGWKAMTDRPDGREHTLAGEFATATLPRFAGDDDNVVANLDQGRFNEDQLDEFEGFRFKVVVQLPSRNGNECSQCGMCEHMCPTGAMDCISGTADPNTCMACLGCVAICPENALAINNMEQSWQKKLAMGDTTEEELNSQVGRLYL